jgi:hypothetical protein
VEEESAKAIKLERSMMDSFKGKRREKGDGDEEDEDGYVVGGAKER